MPRPLFNRGFLSLLLTQFFGAANDNILKQVLSFGVALAGLWASSLGDGGQAYVALCLTIPFILFSGYAGQLADRYSKQRITLAVKVTEIFIALFVLLSFMLVSVWLLLAGMVLFAVQSAFFGPAKYGMIPELVEAEQLSRANGVINMLTNIAVILGTLIAGPLYSAYHPASVPGYSANTPANHWLPGVVMTVVAIAGLGASLLIPKLERRDPDLRFEWNPIGIYWRAIRLMARSPLLMVALAWAFFYLIAMIAMLILPDYKALLNISAGQTSILFAVLAVAIGVGSVLAGVLSGKHIELRLVPIGAIGMAVVFFLLGVTALNYWLIAGLLLLAGSFAGLYIVPLQAMLQFLSPAEERGRFLGTANALSFVCLSLGAVVFLVARSVFQLPPNRVFLICAALAIIGIGVLMWRLRTLINDPRLRQPGEWDRPVCLNCGYDLTGSIAAQTVVCPECGVAIADELRARVK